MFVDETRAAVEFVVVTVDYRCQKRLEIGDEKKRADSAVFVGN